MEKLNTDFGQNQDIHEIFDLIVCILNKKPERITRVSFKVFVFNGKQPTNQSEL